MRFISSRIDQIAGMANAAKAIGQMEMYLSWWCVTKAVLTNCSIIKLYAAEYKMNKWFVMMCALGLSTPTYAFSCYLTVVKSSCWKNYNVTVILQDPTNKDKEVTSVLIPANRMWAREKFECQPGQKLKFKAKFNPVFWEGDEGKVYMGKKYWELPKEVKKKELAWNISLCYPQQFAEVPLPPEAGGNCTCNMKEVPPIPPQ